MRSKEDEIKQEIREVDYTIERLKKYKKKLLEQLNMKIGYNNLEKEQRNRGKRR